MSTRLKDLLKSPEWIWRYLITALLVLASLYLRTSFVTREEYTNDRTSLASSLMTLNASITGLNLNLELLKQGSSRLQDHEERIRALERRQ